MKRLEIISSKTIDAKSTLIDRLEEDFPGITILGRIDEVINIRIRSLKRQSALS